MKIKTTVILIATLLIGIVLGSLGTGYFVRKKVKNISRRFREPDRFKHHLIERLNVSEDQQVIIEPMIEAHFKQRHGLRKQHFNDLIKMEEDFQKKVSVHLEDDQMEYLRRRLERLKRRFERRGRGKPRRHHRKEHHKPE
ncbi:hypothetical protein [Microscilla marina]|uniref:Periplasmic heavy metal sensor n=1 Tax=Microscilla marina ATCC 23134 TaxID=313606 RepID=A1ZJG4_MICM2|nr:hypothetical protein [Microscilla marina]EAY29267.1 hypothetical protein M23134_01321 [Microscilla marina ATCC 23134]